MTAFTPLGLPYPEVTDRVADGWDAIRDLAVAVDGLLALRATSAAVAAGDAALDARLDAIEAQPGGNALDARLDVLEAGAVALDGRLDVLEAMPNGGISNVPAPLTLLSQRIYKFLGHIVVVEFRITWAGGTLSGDSEGSIPTTFLGYLPAGFRPVTTHAFYATTGEGGAGGRMLAGGDINLEWVLPTADLNNGDTVTCATTFSV